MQSFNKPVTNISQLIFHHAQLRPDEIALVAPRKSWLNYINPFHQKYEHLTFLELETRCNLYTHALQSHGVKKEMKVLVFISPSLYFAPLIFALFRIGAIPVMIDPGMGVDNMLSCISQVKAQVLLGVPKIHHLRLLKRKFFQSIEMNIVVDGKAIGATSLEKICEKCIDGGGQGQPTTFAPMISDTGQELGAILFTSGGTGTPKGVMYTQKIFYEQTLKLKQMFELTSQEVDLPCFPLFSLFTLCLGMKSCIPHMDPSRPAQCDPKMIVKDLQHHHVSFAAGSPAIFARVAKYCLKKKIQLPHLQAVVMFGAPVSVTIHEDFKKILTCGKVYTPYGATECLPVTCVSSKTILGETKTATEQGAGVCVGYPAPGVEIMISDEQEVLVHSSTVTLGYYDNEQSTKQVRSVINGKTFHHMGDLGRIDEYGRLWFYGRKVHCFKIHDTHYYSTQVECIFDQHPLIDRCALIDLGDRPALVIERIDKMTELPEDTWQDFCQELRSIAKKYLHTKNINDFFLYRDFPVDARHNIKIDRAFLQQWARGQVQ